MSKRPVGRSPQSLKFGQATTTLGRNTEKERERNASCSVATFQKRIASQRFWALRSGGFRSTKFQFTTKVH